MLGQTKILCMYFLPSNVCYLKPRIELITIDADLALRCLLRVVPECLLILKPFNSKISQSSFIFKNLTTTLQFLSLLLVTSLLSFMQLSWLSKFFQSKILNAIIKTVVSFKSFIQEISNTYFFQKSYKKKRGV